MNGDAPRLPLTDIGDEDIDIAARICRRANAARPTDNPSRALLEDAYPAELAEQGIDPSKDGVIYSCLWNTSNAVVKTWRETGVVDYLAALAEVQADYGITIVEHDEDGTEITHEVQPERVVRSRKQVVDKRRVSFDDARMHETWIRERTETLTQQDDAPAGLLSQPPVRASLQRRARSVSSERGHPMQHASREKILYGRHQPAADQASDPDGPGDSSMLRRSEVSFEKMATLQDLREVCEHTRGLRLLRIYFDRWFDKTHLHQQYVARQHSEAERHDAKVLSQIVFDVWREKLHERQDVQRQVRVAEEAELERQTQQQQEDERMQRLEQRAEKCRGKMLLRKGLQHWFARHEVRRAELHRASKLLLAMRYFRRWKHIALENATKARSIVTRKYIRLWRERTARSHFAEEQAAAHHEEQLQRQCVKKWAKVLFDIKLEKRRIDRIKHAACKKWLDTVHRIRALEAQAVAFRSQRLVQQVFIALQVGVHRIRDLAARAQAIYAQTRLTTAFSIMRIQGRLKPLENLMTLRVNLTLERKAFATWHLQVQLAQQAADFDEKRIKRIAWHGWVDAMKCRVVTQHINARVVIESLYRWMLQERLQLFRRTADARLLRRSFAALKGMSTDLQAQLDMRAYAFAQGQHRRRLAGAMFRLHLLSRQREDAERAAVEFANSRALPAVLETWHEKTTHFTKLTRWATDARFYCLCSAALKRWREATVEHQHQRRRDAYAHVRSRYKHSLVGQCFALLQSKSAQIQSMTASIGQRARTSKSTTIAQLFATWRSCARTLQTQSLTASQLDTSRLLSSALTALTSQHARTTSLDTQAETFAHTTSLSLALSALKTLQWATFTASQQSHTALALQSRNRDQHIRHMLRHWVSQTAARRAIANAEPDIELEAEPESPSLRPASRAAARSLSRDRLRDRYTSPTRPAQGYVGSTPGYLRTPSRSRRAVGRFRPIPTPGPYTPLAFTPAYLVTATPGVQVDEGAELNMGSSPPAPTGLAQGGQVTPFAQRLREVGVVEAIPTSAITGTGAGGSRPVSVLRRGLRQSVTGGTGTGKSVRFAGAGRFSSGGTRSQDHLKSS
ncbi:hypothetical protein LTR95_009937 [Oleoguttula sp. CCFEE 5521]